MDAENTGNPVTPCESPVVDVDVDVVVDVVVVVVVVAT
jgi:hypothetical protein